MSLAWPLPRNNIRQQVRNNAYGMVRNGGTKAHQGWDLVAMPMTPCYAIADGKITDTDFSLSYGHFIELEFTHHFHTYYAFYAHLTFKLARRGEEVRKGKMIGYTGNTGNAASMTGEDQHLHFEIRTRSRLAAPGLVGRIDPARLYGFTPQSSTVFQGPAKGGTTGMKVPGVNVQERPE